MKFKRRVGYFERTLRFPRRQLEIAVQCFKEVRKEIVLSYAISCGGRSYWKATNLQINNDFSMAEFIRNRPSTIRGKVSPKFKGVSCGEENQGVFL
jgi:hypothetical protein|tara:strand:- start:4 stop:291 length:288 start_codon:yes stop_codon:yes gene_type:complete